MGIVHGRVVGTVDRLDDNDGTGLPLATNISKRQMD